MSTIRLQDGSRTSASNIGPPPRGTARGHIEPAKTGPEVAILNVLSTAAPGQMQKPGECRKPKFFRTQSGSDESMRRHRPTLQILRKTGPEKLGPRLGLSSAPGSPLAKPRMSGPWYEDPSRFECVLWRADQLRVTQRAKCVVEYREEVADLNSAEAVLFDPGF